MARFSASGDSRLQSAHLTRPWGQLRVWLAGDGPPLLLIHGLGGSGRYWQSLSQAVAHRYHVIAPDLAGFGGSNRTAHSFDRRSHLDDIDAVVERFAPAADVVVAGHSLGGLLGALWAGRTRARVAGLAVVAAPFPHSQAPAWLGSARPRPARRALHRGARLVVPVIAVPLGLARGYPLPMVVDFTRQTVQSRDGTMRSLLGEPEVPEELAALAGLDAETPVLLMAASDDRLVSPGALQGWAALFPQAETRLLGGGHQLLLRGGLDVLVRWLDAVAGHVPPFEVDPA
jgi:pimeloyl-ACP methyl ester carboxylesterase